jgi:hypothetical protein
MGYSCSIHILLSVHSYMVARMELRHTWQGDFTVDHANQRALAIRPEE